jgi:hypothetical protein
MILKLSSLLFFQTCYVYNINMKIYIRVPFSIALTYYYCSNINGNCSLILVYEQLTCQNR